MCFIIVALIYDCQQTYNTLKRVLLRQVFQKEIDKSDIDCCLAKAKKLIDDMESRNDYFYLEARYAMETIVDDDAALYVARKYFERADKLEISKAKDALRKVEYMQREIGSPAEFYDELCKPLK